MKTPKSLEKLADSANSFVEALRFTSNGQTQKGYAIVDADGNELLECTPVFYSNGDRWKVINRTDESFSLQYYKSLAGIDKKQTIKPGRTGYKWTQYTGGRNGKILNYGGTTRLNN